ncbi:MAG: SIR2 family protein [Candidatus Bathyarchaeia archaeon]
MLTIIFGAGASYDSAPSHRTEENGDWHQYPFRPPLADHLFQERPLFAEVCRKFPRLWPLIPELRHLDSGTSVEHQLEKLRGQTAELPYVKKQLAAVRFYLQWVIWECQRMWDDGTTKGVTNYATLLNHVERHRRGEPVCLVTFNYDTLLEQAFASINRKFSSIDAYVTGNDYLLFKLHGSVNWVHDLNSSVPMNSDKVVLANQIVEADNVDVSDRFHVAPENLSPPPCVSSMSIPGKAGLQPVFPAISIPVLTKNQFECPSTHVNLLKKLISQTDKLVMIGWRGAEENFVDLLCKGVLFHKKIPILVVSGSKDGANRVVSKFQKLPIMQQSWQVAEGGFTDIILSRGIEDFIISQI